MAAADGIFCDWLDVTHPADSTPADDLRLFLLTAHAEVRHGDVYRVGDGTVKIDRKARFTRCSASGGALAHFRLIGAYSDFLGLLGTLPHRVTRLDAALDIPLDGADVIAALRRQYADGQVRLGRKALGVKMLLAVRPDGRETGTFYVGHRSAARATARVYDKAWERSEKAGIEGPPRTRYEVTVRKDYGATLRDAAEPARLFWHVASPALLEAPGDAEPWDSSWADGWSAPTVDLLPAEVLSRRVSSSPELELLLSVADRLGPNGRILLARRVLQRLGVDAEGLSLPASSLAALGDSGAD